MTPWTVAHQASLFMGFPRSGLPFPSPGNLPDPGIEAVSPTLASGFFTSEPPGKPHLSVNTTKTPACPSSLYVGWQVVSTQKKVSLPVYLNPATL